MSLQPPGDRLEGMNADINEEINAMRAVFALGHKKN